MEQVISAPDEGWIDYIARMWLLGSRISNDLTGQQMDGSLADIERIQEIIDLGSISRNQTQELQALGICFGKVFVNQTPHYDWWIVEDDFGKDVCIRYKKTTLLAFPQTMLSKRIEDSEVPDVLDMFQGLQAQLERIRLESYPDA